MQPTQRTLDSEFSLLTPYVSDRFNDGTYTLNLDEAKTRKLWHEVDAQTLELAAATAELAEKENELRRVEAMFVQRTRELQSAQTALATATAQLEAAEAERKKLLGYYKEIVATIGHDGILKEHHQRGELLRQEVQWRKEAESQLAATTAELGRLYERYSALEAVAKRLFDTLSRYSSADDWSALLQEEAVDALSNAMQFAAAQPPVAPQAQETKL